MKIADALCDLLWPPRCAGCETILPFGTKEIFCPSCAEAWEKAIREICPKCGAEQRRCECPVGEIGQIHLFAYHPGRADPCGRMLLSLKKKKRKKVFAFLGKRLSERIGDRGNDAVFCYVPRDRKKKRLLGVDQALGLADAAAKTVGKRAFSPIVSRGGEEQKHLNAKERGEAAREKYRVDPEKLGLVRGKDVILFDDIITTGSTVRICAELLLRNGARSVTAAAAARTAGDSDPGRETPERSSQ